MSYQNTKIFSGSLEKTTSKKFLISIILFTLFNSASSFERDDELFEEDCDTFNFDAACRPEPAPPPARTNFIKDQIVLLYESNKGAGVKDLTKRYNLRTISQNVLSSVATGMVVAKTNGQNPLVLSKAINKKEKDVEASTNNAFTPAITSFKDAYSMVDTGVRSVHATTKGNGITICMVDTPIDIFHPSLSDALIETSEMVDFNPDDYDTMMHGTSVAGVLVSQNQHIGIAPKAKLFAISAFTTTKARPHILQGSSSNIAKAIDSCIQHDVDVINLSFTGGRDALVEKLVNKAIDKGIIVVAAGGNGGHWGSTIYPAVIPGVLATTAVDQDKQLYSLADKGTFIDYAAPGVNVLTIAPQGKYKLASGTSISSAHLSGIVALLLSQKKSKSIEKTLTETAIDLGKPGRDQEFGEGLVSASRALATIRNRK